MLTLLSLIAIGAFLVASEYWWRSKSKTHLEHPRKIVHIIIGTFIAFWPFYMGWTAIRIASFALLVGVLLSKAFKVFRAIHEADRVTIGEVCFALSIGLLTFITSNRWIFMAAILQMSLADGFAGLIGTRFGGNSRYKVLGAVKSIVGTTTFFVVSLSVLLVVGSLGHLNLPLQIALLIAVLASVIENFAIYGLDDLALPLYVALMLHHY